MLIALPALSVYAYDGCRFLRKSKGIWVNLAIALLVIGSFGNILAGYWLIGSYANYDKHADLRDVCLYVKDRTPTDATVMANFWPYVNYYADRACVGFPKEEDFMRVLNGYKVSYVLISRYISPPEYIHSYLRDGSLFSEEFKIEQNGEIVVAAYRYLGFTES